MDDNAEVAAARLAFSRAVAAVHKLERALHRKHTVATSVALVCARRDADEAFSALQVARANQDEDEEEST
jgi:hypothetical protein